MKNKIKKTKKQKKPKKTKKRGGASLQDICSICKKSNNTESIIVCRNGHKCHYTCICEDLMYAENVCNVCSAPILRNVVNICESTSNLNKSIETFKDNWMCSKGSNCHHTSYGLSKILNNATYTLKPISNNNIMHHVEDLYPFFDKKQHYLLHVHAPSHHFYIEIVNKKFRLISLWDSLHGIHNYYLTGPYGKLNKLSDIFIENIEKLCSGNNQLIKEALEHLFGEKETYTDYLDKSVKFDVFELNYT